MSVIFLNNPYTHILNTFEELYPNVDVEIELVPQEALNEKSLEMDGCPIAYGVTLYLEEAKPDGPRRPIEIKISMNLDVYDSAEVLCHELAHAVVGYEADHNEEWECVFNLIMDKSQERMKTLYQQLFGDIDLMEIESNLSEVIDRDRKDLGLDVN